MIAMPNRLDIPDELNSLIEKREEERRQDEAGSAENPDVERRSGKDRREQGDGEAQPPGDPSDRG